MSQGNRLGARVLRIVIPVVALALAAAACTSTDDEASDDEATGSEEGADEQPSANAEPQYEPVLEERECNAEEMADVPDGTDLECSWLVVPVDRTAPEAGELRLAVRVLPSTAEDPADDPMVFVSGGPGAPGGEAAFWSAQPYVAERDVVLWDQRGTGNSEPNMDCPEAEEAFVGFFTADRELEEDRALRDAAFEACRDRLADEGVDFEAFSTPVNSADLADLRTALGYDEWNIYGLSYGTRLAMETMRAHPEGIRSVVLDSAYPMDQSTAQRAVEGAEYVFQQLSEACASAPACAAAHDDLRADIASVVEMYDAEPYRSVVEVNGSPVEIVLTGQDIQAGIYEAIYGHALIGAIPAFVSSLQAGNGAILDPVAAQSIEAQGTGAEAMGHLVDCADASAVDNSGDAELLEDPGEWGAMLLFVSFTACDVWPAATVDESFAEPVTADIPVLILAGALDPATPLPGARSVAESLPSATLVEFAGHGHGLWNDTPCAAEIADAFFSDPTGDLDTSCAEATEPPTFD